MIKAAAFELVPKKSRVISFSSCSIPIGIDHDDLAFRFDPDLRNALSATANVVNQIPHVSYFISTLQRN